MVFTSLQKSGNEFYYKNKEKKKRLGLKNYQVCGHTYPAQYLVNYPSHKKPENSRCKNCKKSGRELLQINATFKKNWAFT